VSSAELFQLSVEPLTFDLSYVITELLQSDLHKIIVSPQHLSADHIKVFLYQILRGKCCHNGEPTRTEQNHGNIIRDSSPALGNPP
jgi:hypothetical protein